MKILAFSTSCLLPEDITQQIVAEKPFLPGFQLDCQTRLTGWEFRSTGWPIEHPVNMLGVALSASRKRDVSYAEMKIISEMIKNTDNLPPSLTVACSPPQCDQIQKIEWECKREKFFTSSKK